MYFLFMYLMHMYGSLRAAVDHELQISGADNTIRGRKYAHHHN